MRFLNSITKISIICSIAVFFSCGMNGGTEGERIDSICTGECIDPFLKLEPSAFNLSCQIDGSTSATLNITNEGEGILNWSATSDKGWISFDVSSGKAPSSLLITADCSAMSEGDQSASVTISSDEAGSKSASISLTVMAVDPEEPPDPTDDNFDMTMLVNEHHLETYGVIKDKFSNSIILTGQSGQFFDSNFGIYVAKVNEYNEVTHYYAFDDYGTPEDIAQDKQGNVIITGYFNNGHSFPGQDLPEDDMFLVKFDKDLNLLWAKQMGSDQDDRAHALALDADGNIYVVGETAGDGDTWAELEGLSSSDLFDDFFIIKFDPDGNKIWAELRGTSNEHDSAGGIAIDSAGYVYISGYTNGNLDGIHYDGYQDLFLVKYDSDGIRVWTKQFGTESDDFLYDMKIDGNDDLVMSGFSYRAVDGSGGIASNDATLFKYDKNGNSLWAAQAGTSGTYDEGVALAIDGNNNIYMLVETEGIVDPDQTNQGSWDFALVKFDAQGNKQWARQFGTDEHDRPRDVCVDENNFVWAVGYTRGFFDPYYNPTYADSTFMLKYSF